MYTYGCHVAFDLYMYSRTGLSVNWVLVLTCHHYSMIVLSQQYILCAIQLLTN